MEKKTILTGKEIVEIIDRVIECTEKPQSMNKIEYVDHLKIALKDVEVCFDVDGKFILYKELMPAKSR